MTAHSTAAQSQSLPLQNQQRTWDERSGDDDVDVSGLLCKQFLHASARQPSASESCRIGTGVSRVHISSAWGLAAHLLGGDEIGAHLLGICMGRVASACGAIDCRCATHSSWLQQNRGSHPPWPSPDSSSSTVRNSAPSDLACSAIAT